MGFAAKLLKKADPQLIRQLDNGKKRSLLDAYKETFPKEKVEETEEEEYSPAPPKNKKAGKLIKESAWEEDPEKEEDGAGDETVGSSSVGKKKKKNLPEVEEESEDFEELREIKYDGYRMQARIDGRTICLLTRKKLDWTERFRSIADALKAFGLGSAWIDGEIVVEDASGLHRTLRSREHRIRSSGTGPGDGFSDRPANH